MLSAVVALAATMAGAVPPLEVRGAELVNPDTGNKFQVVGMAYQPGGSAAYNPINGADPLSHADTCLRDAALMQVMGVNTIRVYNLNPDVSHDECASIFNAAGIYMIIDVNSPLAGESITSSQPWESYGVDYLKHTFAVVEAFCNYPNTLLFFSGNEVINDVHTAQHVPPYLRATTRDLKNYIEKNIEGRIKRKIPVGYSAADVRSVLWDTWHYLECALDGDASDPSRVDVFALNSYSWCGPTTTFVSSTFNVLTDRFEKSSVPVFFSEYGCNMPTPRYWNETTAIYGDEMRPVFSGGVVYEWTEEENGYGLVGIKDGVLSIMGDYNRLKEQWAKIDWQMMQSQPAAKNKVEPPKCDASLIQDKTFNNSFTLPAIPPGAQKLIDTGINPKPGGRIVKISDYKVKMTVKDSHGDTVSGLKVVPLKEKEFNWAGRNTAETGTKDGADKGDGTKGQDQGQGQGKGQGQAQSHDQDNGKAGGDDGEDTGVLTRPMMWAATLPLVVMLFA